MLFTDGGEDRAQDIFEQYNWPNKTVSEASMYARRDTSTNKNPKRLGSVRCVNGIKIYSGYISYILPQMLCSLDETLLDLHWNYEATTN